MEELADEKRKNPSVGLHKKQGEKEKTVRVRQKMPAHVPSPVAWKGKRMMEAEPVRPEENGRKKNKVEGFQAV